MYVCYVLQTTCVVSYVLLDVPGVVARWQVWICLINCAECKMMQNRKAMGSLQEHFIRQHSKPAIVEMENPTSPSVSKDPSHRNQLITEIGNGNGDQ